MDLWQTHLDAILSLDAGEGWFRDAHFDYYNAWVFHLYAPIVCRFWAYEHAPEIAALMERQSRELMANYPEMFGRDGTMLMWGRSIAYRTGAISPFPVCYHFRNPPPLPPGRARRLCSGNLLQFVGHPRFLVNGVPSLGFYGHFEHAIQSYSCSASPMWGYLNFLSAFSLPASHPFWTAIEEEGPWPSLASGLREVVANAPGLCITQHGTSGSVELRPGKAEPDDPSYNRLAYHSAFPWEAHDPALGSAMHYTRRTDNPVTGEAHRFPVKIHWIGHHGGVLYRQLRMSHHIMGCPAVLDLADIAVPAGLLRVDRPRLYLSGELRLCHYALPHLEGRPAELEHRSPFGFPALIARIPGRQVALVALSGWDDLGSAVHTGFSPEADDSTLIFATHRHGRYPSLTPKVALLLHRLDDRPWTDEELVPVARWSEQSLATHGVRGSSVLLRDGRSFEINYNGAEGCRQD